MVKIGLYDYYSHMKKTNKDRSRRVPKRTAAVSELKAGLSAYLARVKAGDDDAFDHLVEKFRRPLVGFLYRMARSHAVAEELTQEVFLRVYRSRQSYRASAKFTTWMYRIAVNLCIDEVRRKRIRKAVSLEFFTERRLESEKRSKERALASDDVLDDEKKKTVVAALQKLSPVHRTVILLREYEDMSYEEIAKTLHISAQAVKSRIFRAREELRKLLKDYFKERV